MTQDMMIVFNQCITKAAIKQNVKNNTTTPWKDYTTEHLIKRLDDEWNEWKESGQMNELIDIINMATFVWLSKLSDSACTYTGDCEENTEQADCDVNTQTHGRNDSTDSTDAKTEQVQ